jgi:hypothetical protein
MGGELIPLSRRRHLPTDGRKNRSSIGIFGKGQALPSPARKLDLQRLLPWNGIEDSAPEPRRAPQGLLESDRPQARSAPLPTLPKAFRFA